MDEPERSNYHPLRRNRHIAGLDKFMPSAKLLAEERPPKKAIVAPSIRIKRLIDASKYETRRFKLGEVGLNQVRSDQLTRDFNKTPDTQACLEPEYEPIKPVKSRRL